MGLHVSIGLPWHPAHQNRLVHREPCRCRRAVSGTGSSGRQIAEKGNIWIENEGQFIVVPHWVKLSKIGYIERALLAPKHELSKVVSSCKAVSQSRQSDCGT